jgi:hypothetical protein
MIPLKSLILENNWPSLILDDKYLWYHGRTVDSEVFSYDYVGGENATDQEGPGFYFTNSFENAKRYASPDGVILKCKINYKKLIIKGNVSNTKTDKKIIIDLINSSPDKDYTLENFDENPRLAMIKAVNAYLVYKNAHDAYQLIANDFYKYNSKNYLQILAKYYDAQLTKLDNTYYGGTIYHLIVYNPSLITVVDKIKI